MINSLDVIMSYVIYHLMGDNTFVYHLFGCKYNYFRLELGYIRSGLDWSLDPI